jgi:L-rhamnose mutarotase
VEHVSWQGRPGFPAKTNFDYIEALEYAQLRSRRKGRKRKFTGELILEGNMMKRYGSVIGVRPEAIEEYKKLHAAVWPDVLEMIRKCNIRNYSIFLKHNFLFGYFEYHGTDFQADMAKMAADPKTQEWWKLTGPMQRPLESRAEGEWWASMEEVFHSN